MTSRLLGFYLLFYGALAAGILLRRWRGASPPIMRWTILLLEPWLFLYSMWVLDLQQLRHYAGIPLAAVLLILLPLFLIPPLARRLLPQTGSQGSFILAAAFSNIGNTGGAFLCYLLFGQLGLSLAYLYLVPYPFLIFTLGFSLAKRYSGGSALSLRDYVRATLANPLSAVPLAAMAAGILLNVCGLKPLAGAQPVVNVLLRADLAVMCLAIGMTLNWPSWRRDWRPMAATAAVKFVGLPLLALPVACLLYGSLTAIPARVLLIEAAMPAAVYTVVTANLFNLDRELANTLWISTTLLLAPVAWIIFLCLR